MKPFITDPLQNGKYILPYQIGGLAFSEIRLKLISSSIVGYSLPISQSLRETWDLHIYLDTGISITFSSACTGVGGWQEMGSLNMDFSGTMDMDKQVESKYSMTKFDNPFLIEKIYSLVFHDNDIYSESGLIFVDPNGQEVIVATGVSAGSVSMRIPFDDNFEPELAYNDYVRVKWSDLSVVKSR
ncbi:hypothetical protein [Thiothrix lacustris]|uniref:hypothetical protein n=1 Tax=Thiothrix lacustris TaxID=525917 RepID=UPI0027E53489|nr:hypothetical protein [Thiothrix lacustris]WMP18902.1 hypothetical protein RCS87_07520 [Thiothrix lacustris]